MKRSFVALTGASGILYGFGIIKALQKAGQQTRRFEGGVKTNGTNVSPYRPAGSGPVWRNQTGPDHRAG